MGLIGFLAAPGEGCRMSPPASVRIERVPEEARSRMHGTVVTAERAHTGAKAQQHLPSVEGHGHLHSRVNLATLDAAVRELDRGQPVQHAPGPLPKLAAVRP